MNRFIKRVVLFSLLFTNILFFENCGGGFSSGSSQDFSSTQAASTASLSITQQPTSASVNQGMSVSFSVVATGSDLTYQWYKNDVMISGANKSSLILSNVSSADAASYYVQVQNKDGSISSYHVSLTVNSPPSIAQQPQSTAAAIGASAAFTVAALGTGPLVYQWNKNGVAIANATSSSLNLMNLQSTDAAMYTVTITNALGSVTSSGAQLTVNAVQTGVAPSITTQPASQAVSAGSSVTFSVAASGTAALTYQWAFNGVNISGANSSSYSLTGVTAARAGSYTVVVSNGVGSVVSNAAVLAVNVAPSISMQPTSQTVMAGSSVTFSVTAAGTDPLTYQWKLGGVNISGATSSTYTISNTTTAQSGGVYTVIITNSVGSVTSNGATLTVNAVSSGANTCAQNSSSSLIGTVITDSTGKITTNTYNTSANSCAIETTYGAVYGKCYDSYMVQPNVYGAWGSMPANINFSMWSNSASCWGFDVTAPAVDFANPYYWNAPVVTRGFSQGANSLLTPTGGSKISDLNTTYKNNTTHCPSSGAAGSICTKWDMSVPGVTANSMANTASDTYTSWDALIDIYFHAVAKPAAQQLTTFDLQIYQMIMDEYYGGKPAWATYIFGSGKYTTKTIGGIKYLVSVNMGDPGSEGSGWVGRGGTYNCISLVPLPTYPTTTGGTGSYLWGQASAVHDVGAMISWISQVETRVNASGVSQTGIFDDDGNLLYDNVRKASVKTPLLDPTHYLTGFNPGFEVILARPGSLEHPAVTYPNNTKFTTTNLWIALPGETVGH